MKFQMVFKLATWALFIFLFIQSYRIFVDNNKEYPWESKRVLLWDLPTPITQYHLSLFGFPYYRGWDAIGDFVNKDGRSNYYATNERETISRYGISLTRNNDKAGYYIHILNPQNFTTSVVNGRIETWLQQSTPIKTVNVNGRDVSKVYLIPVLE